MPIGLITLPVVTEKANANNNNLGFMPVLRANCSITGVPTIARVSFIRKADKKPTLNSMASTRLFSDFVFPNRRYAR